jgi:hypothetical protein
MSLDGGAAVTVAASAFTPGVLTVRVGKNYSAGSPVFFDGKVMEVITAASALTAPDRADIYTTYLKGRYPAAALP